MTSSPLVGTQWLEDHLEDPDVRIIEVSSIPQDTPYRKGHVPGAAWVYWKDACWHPTDREFVTPAAMAQMFGRMGIGPNTTVVLYGDPFRFGTYAYWVFTMAGHKNLRVLDGGRRKWQLDKRPMSTEPPNCVPVDYPPPLGDQSTRVGRDNVRDHLGRRERLLVDVRAPEEYNGERVIEYAAPFDHGAERYGRIPGAVHLDFYELLNDDDTLKSAEDLRREFAAGGIAPEKFEDVVCYCRLGHRASLAWLALDRVLGHRNIKIYDGSWTEWGSIVGFPVEK